VKAREEINDEMGCFKGLKFWKRAGNSKTGFVRSVLKCLLPCITRRSRSLSPEYSSSIKENKTMENCKETAHGRTGAQYEALVQAERQQELIDIRRMTRKEETSDDICLEESQRGHRREERGLCFEDFKIIRRLGQGGFGNVVLARKEGGLSSSDEVFAIKLVPNKMVCEVEKEVLFRAVGHPFLVQLHAYFRTKESFCYVMEYCEGGTLQSLMSRLNRFHEDLTRLYSAEIILAVNFLHKCGIIHRDIKPGNILLDRDGHCKLADFGLAKVGVFKGMRAGGVCGTVRYRAPEIRRGSLYGPEVDWWSVGNVLFDMMVGDCPAEDLLHPEQHPLCLTKDAVSLLNMFLEKDPSLRLGARGDTRSILMHPFFKSVNWEAVLQKRVKPPVKPVILEFSTVDPAAPGNTDESESDISFKTANEGPVMEGPADTPEPVRCLTVDPGASGKM